jgi:hypothetical protein
MVRASWFQLLPEAPVLSTIPSVITTVFATIAATPHPARDDSCRARDGGRARDRPTAEHAGPANSISTQHL